MWLNMINAKGADMTDYTVTYSLASDQAAAVERLAAAHNMAADKFFSAMMMAGSHNAIDGKIKALMRANEERTIEGRNSAITAFYQNTGNGAGQVL